MRISYLGPKGTYSEEAALEHAAAARAGEGRPVQMEPRGSIAAVVRAVEDGGADEAVVPLENSLEGIVTQTADLLVHHTALRIRREIVLPIHHCLVVAAGQERRAVRVVHSHPQALAQCRGYIERHLAGAETAASLSTAEAVRDMLASDRAAAAISSLRAAKLFGAEVADRNIEDVRTNMTRFVVLAARDAGRTGRDLTSICFDFDEDAAGTLHGVLGELAARDINMTRIESRPDRRSLGRYVFLVDVEGHREDPVVRDALAGIRARASTFKVLGSYPRAAAAPASCA